MRFVATNHGALVVVVVLLAASSSPLSATSVERAAHLAPADTARMMHDELAASMRDQVYGSVMELMTNNNPATGRSYWSANQAKVFLASIDSDVSQHLGHVWGKEAEKQAAMGLTPVAMLDAQVRQDFSDHITARLSHAASQHLATLQHHPAFGNDPEALAFLGIGESPAVAHFSQTPQLPETVANAMIKSLAFKTSVSMEEYTSMVLQNTLAEPMPREQDVRLRRRGATEDKSLSKLFHPELPTYPTQQVDLRWLNAMVRHAKDSAFHLSPVNEKTWISELLSKTPSAAISYRPSRKQLAHDMYVALRRQQVGGVVPDVHQPMLDVISIYKPSVSEESLAGHLAGEFHAPLLDSFKASQSSIWHRDGQLQHLVKSVDQWVQSLSHSETWIELPTANDLDLYASACKKFPELDGALTHVVDDYTTILKSTKIAKFDYANEELFRIPLEKVFHGTSDITDWVFTAHLEGLIAQESREAAEVPKIIPQALRDAIAGLEPIKRMTVIHTGIQKALVDEVAEHGPQQSKQLITQRVQAYKDIRSQLKAVCEEAQGQQKLLIMDVDHLSKYEHAASRAFAQAVASEADAEAAASKANTVISEAKTAAPQVKTVAFEGEAFTAEVVERTVTDVAEKSKFNWPLLVCGVVAFVARDIMLSVCILRRHHPYVSQGHIRQQGGIVD
ncbi:hypothetical protein CAUPRSCDRAFT_11463 [Caulochytrium protostelioides]|uniref:Uncharacterized protein n=1 Tax=Caulochytrium protostelioides TaxID=1555241 RepID=A0A4P9WX87_9FUNG|nr:hypothetical protein CAUPRSCDRAFT_11463 [Caulochytrium protostelioides]